MRAYLIDNDRAKLVALVDSGKTSEEIKSILAKSGEGVSPKAVDDYIAGTPEIAKKLGKKSAAPAEPPKK